MVVRKIFFTWNRCSIPILGKWSLSGLLDTAVYVSTFQMCKCKQLLHQIKYDNNLVLDFRVPVALCKHIAYENVLAVKSFSLTYFGLSLRLYLSCPSGGLM